MTDITELAAAALRAKLSGQVDDPTDEDREARDKILEAKGKAVIRIINVIREVMRLEVDVKENLQTIEAIRALSAAQALMSYCSTTNPIDAAEMYKGLVEVGRAVLMEVINLGSDPKTNFPSQGKSP